jgi:osmotically-inducible protein OsmY
MPNDQAIIDHIRSSLDSDPRLPHPAVVAISEREGRVTLRGTVGSPRQRRAAVEIAKTSRRVREVEDELRIDPRDHWQDDEIRGAALQALVFNPSVPADRIEANVADGWLTLKGEVSHQRESDAAFETVSGLPGVGGITNRIVVITAGVDG